jgi:hypothetical protein
MGFFYKLSLSNQGLCMAKLKNIIKQLSEKDFKLIYDSLIESNAEKSAYLLKALRERSLSDSKVMAELEVNANAYYTMRSRLNQRIEEHLIQKMESPRTDILRKVANLNEVLFTNKRTISIATLQKMERELIDRDLASELTVVYKSLKKMNIHSPEYFTYSQLYNRHVAYMLAVDKAEDLLADYFKKYGIFFLSGENTERIGLGMLMKEMQNVARLYESHRLYVFKSCMLVFHRLFVEPDENLESEEEPIEDIFKKVEGIFVTYNLDPLYYHLNLVFEFLRLEYYNHYKVYRQAEKYYEEVNDAASNLLVNYPYYTFSAQFLISKIERHVRLGLEKELYAENESLFQEFEMDTDNLPMYVIYTTYKALSSYYSGRYDEAGKFLNTLLADVSIKKYTYVVLELKTLMALQFVMQREIETFNTTSISIMRGLRSVDEDESSSVFHFLKILKIAVSEAKREKEKKIMVVIPQLKAAKVKHFAPTRLIQIDEEFIKKLISIESF